MYILKYADYVGVYHGFNLKKGFWYGIDTETNQYIATSAWEVERNVAIYFLEKNGWKMHWVGTDAEFQISNIPAINTKGKMPFNEWLEKKEGMTRNEYDDIWSEVMLRELEDGYSSYFYDGLPRFAYKNL